MTTTTREKIEAITAELNQETFRDDYARTEKELVNIFADYIDKALLECAAYGTGVVVGTMGDTLADLIVDIDFSGTIRQFMLSHIIFNARFIMFSNPYISETFIRAWAIHEELTKQLKEFTEAERLQQIEAEKKAEADKKAEAKYQKAKESSIKAFETLTERPKASTSQADEFYYALGWLAKHVGTMTATLPDYLSDTFQKHFGDVPHTTIDGRKRTVNGYAMQWTFSFKATLRKAENVPAFLTQYLSSNGKAIADTSFVWDLVDTYGFQFGKKQDVEKIKETIPSQYIVYFEEGQNS